MILNSPATCEVIAAGPKVLAYISSLPSLFHSRKNGFYGSRGVSRLIPEGYTLLEQRFMRAVRAVGRLFEPCDGAITLSEWERQDWMYHAKGIVSLSLAAGKLTLHRYLVVPFRRQSSHFDNVWPDEYQLTIPQPRRRAFLCNTHILRCVAAIPTRGCTQLAIIDRIVERCR